VYRLGGVDSEPNRALGAAEVAGNVDAGRPVEVTYSS
jgi:hypothetical protein